MRRGVTLDRASLKKARLVDIQRMMKEVLLEVYNPILLILATIQKARTNLSETSYIYKHVISIGPDTSSKFWYL